MNDGATGDTLLVVEIAADQVEDFEWIEDCKSYREFCVPASVLNQAGKVTELLE